MKKSILTTHPTNIYRNGMSANLNEKDSKKKEREEEEELRRKQNKRHEGDEEYIEKDPNEKTMPNKVEKTEQEGMGRSEKAKKQNTDESDSVKKKK
ncbi:hypothetical protein JKA74_03390 [Marivirga sp. S37H4]|uniref:Uncharacterized protein n=1 Tax=Marivirga aurantiaca TaxID=2802615 RepID=A0A935C5Y3_9BACT|nr:hypothetical protein [Marivirga aurantiaca]MBK6264069.1 hypothetical protein [Marivirga aurantiaca]